MHSQVRARVGLFVMQLHGLRGGVDQHIADELLKTLNASLRLAIKA